MNDERLHTPEGAPPEGIPETKREIKEKKETKPKAAAEGSPEAGGEGGPPA